MIRKLAMPFKHNSARRHHIPRQRFRVMNWPEYEAGLRKRGSITFWLSDEALASWSASKRQTRGGQRRYSDLAIQRVCFMIYRFVRSKALLVPCSN